MVTVEERDIIRDVLLAVMRAKGGGSVTVKYVPGVGLSVSGTAPAQAGRPGREQFALVEFTAADGTDAWKYVAREVVADDETADPPTYTVKDPGRTWGVDSDDEGLVIDLLRREGLEDVGDGITPVYWVRRVARKLGDGGTFWVVVGGGGSGLPDGTGQYKVLQLDADDEPHWDWVRAH
jgi:hypothetical protein